MWGPLPIIVKVKFDKFLGTDEKVIGDKFSGKNIT